MTRIVGPILDSAGNLATGLIIWTQVVPYQSDAGFTTRTPVTAQVIDGVILTLDQAPFDIPGSPDGTYVAVQEQFDGNSRDWVTAVPDQAEIAYGELPVLDDDGSLGSNPTFDQIIAAASQAAASAAAAAASAGAAAATLAGALTKTSNLSDLTNPGTARSNLGLGNVDNTSDVNKPVSTAQAAADALNIPLTQKGAVSGVATLDSSGKVPSTQLNIPTTNDTIMASVAASPGSAFRIAQPANVRATTPKHVSGLYPSSVARWTAAVSNVLNGTKDAKLLICGDSTAGGVGGGSSSTFIQANSWPSYLVAQLDAVVAPTAHGLAVPPSNSGSVTSPYDSRWTLGSGWSWRSGAAFDAFLGFGGKGTNISGTPTATGTLTFNDSRILADRFDVYYVANDGATGATFTAQATGGSSVSGTSSSWPSKSIRKVTVKASMAATSNVVTITMTGGTANLWIVGIEPYLSTARKIRVANAGISGSSSVGWTAFPSGSSANTWNSVAAITGYAPDLTIFDIMINDADPANLTSLSTYLSNMQTLIAAANLSGDVILRTPIPSDSTRYAQEQSLIAQLQTLGLPMIDVFGYYGVYISGLMSDGLHGNSTMYQDEADYIAGVLWSLRTPASTTPPALPVPGYNRRFASLATPGIVGGSVSSVPDLAGSGTVLTPTVAGGSVTAPTITSDGGRRVLSFNGVSQGLGQALSMSQPHSVVVVGRFTSFTSDTIQPITSGTGTAGSRANLYRDNATGNVVANAGASLVGGASDTNYHVFIFNSDTTSVLAIDTTEVSGSAGTNPRTFLMIATLDGTHFGAINVLDVVTYPFALTSTQRASTVAALRAGYALD